MWLDQSTGKKKLRTCVKRNIHLLFLRAVRNHSLGTRTVIILYNSEILVTSSYYSFDSIYNTFRLLIRERRREGGRGEGRKEGKRKRSISLSV